MPHHERSELMPGDGGRWLVETVTGSRHLIDLDAMTYARLGRRLKLGGGLDTAATREILLIEHMPKQPDATSTWIEGILHEDPGRETATLWDAYQEQENATLSRESFAVKVSRVRARVSGSPGPSRALDPVPSRGIAGDDLATVIGFFKSCLDAPFAADFYELADKAGVVNAIDALEQLIGGNE